MMLGGGDTAQLSVTRSLVSVGYELHETRGKTRTARRSINLDARTIHMLDRWRQHRRDEDPEFDPGDLDGHVFSRPDGAPTHPRLLSDSFRRLVYRSGLPRIRFHDLRHTHAMEYLNVETMDYLNANPDTRWIT